MTNRTPSGTALHGVHTEAESSGLAGLLARVEAAMGRRAWDDPLNDDLHLALGWTRELDHEVYGGKHPAPWEWTDPDGHYCAHHIEDATRSLDAALAMVERVLPNDWPYAPKPFWLPTISQRFNGDWEARLYRADKGKRFDAVSKTAPLAIIASLLKALIAKEAA